MFGSNRGHDSGLRRETEVSETPPLVWTQPTHYMSRSQGWGLWRAGLCCTVQPEEHLSILQGNGERTDSSVATSMEPGSCGPHGTNLNSGPPPSSN